MFIELPDSGTSNCKMKIGDGNSTYENLPYALGTQDNNKAQIVDIIYPVGSIYMSVNNTSPAILFGGTWEQLKDRFLLGTGDTYTAGGTGGEATHKLTVQEMPSHNHTFTHTIRWTGYGMSTGSAYSEGLYYKGPETWFGINNTGGSQAHNNMPPYLAVYIWKRTA